MDRGLKAAVAHVFAEIFTGPWQKKKEKVQCGKFLFLNAFHLKDCLLLQDYFLACFDVKSVLF